MCHIFHYFEIALKINRSNVIYKKNRWENSKDYVDVFKLGIVELLQDGNKICMLS